MEFDFLGYRIWPAELGLAKRRRYILTAVNKVRQLYEQKKNGSQKSRMLDEQYYPLVTMGMAGLDKKPVKIWLSVARTNKLQFLRTQIMK